MNFILSVILQSLLVFAAVNKFLITIKDDVDFNTACAAVEQIVDEIGGKIIKKYSSGIFEVDFSDEHILAIKESHISDYATIEMDSTINILNDL